MSHVTVIDLEIRDLECLAEAAEALGLEFRTHQTSFKWWGYSVGDYPLPAGFTAADMGKCEHALAVKGNPNAYEVGVVRRRDGKPGHILMWDFFAGGEGLQAVVGDNCKKLAQKYAEKVVMKNAKGLQAKGWNVSLTKNAAGESVVRCLKG